MRGRLIAFEPVQQIMIVELMSIKFVFCTSEPFVLSTASE